MFKMQTIWKQTRYPNNIELVTSISLSITEIFCVTIKKSYEKRVITWEHVHNLQVIKADYMSVNPV